MNKNTTVSDLNIEIHREGNSFKKHLVAKIGICCIEFLLSSVFYCYGILLSEYVLIGSREYEEGIWASFLFICSWSFTDPVARFFSEYFEDRKNTFFRYLVGCSTAALFIGVMIPRNLTLYMIFGGILSNLISTQIRVFAMDKLDMDPKIFEAHRQVSRAISLFVLPHCVFALIAAYEINQAKFIFAALLLNIIPAALIVKTEENWNGTGLPEMSRYQTIGRFANQMNEMKNFGKENEQDDNKSDTGSSSSEENPIFELNPQFLQVVSETNPQAGHQNRCDENYNAGQQTYESSFVNEHSVSDLDVPTSFLNPVNVYTYYNNVGVSILPGIPEESEDEIDDINYIDPKRLSRISDKLEVLKVHDQIRKDSIKEIFSINEVVNEHRPEPINKIEYIANFREDKARISVLDELKNLNKAKHCFHCSPYRKYIWTRRLRMLKDFLNDNFLRPLYHSLKNLYFYPALTTKIVTNVVSTLYITLAPFMAMQKSWKQHLIFSTENATFLLTYIAFAWCFFLVSLPLVQKLNHAKLRMVFGFGLVISGTSLSLLTGKLTNDSITISSLLFGFGYGIITYTEKIVFSTSIGMRPWYLVRGPLEVLSAIFIMIIYYLIYFHRLELKVLLLLATLAYYFNAVLWFCLPFIKYCTSIIIQKIVFDQRSQQEGFFH